MPDIGQGQVGQLKSIPKLVRINGDDNARVIWKNMGNNHAYPLMWSTTHTVVSGADTVVASGVKFHGLTLAGHANVNVTVTSGTQDGYVYVSKDATANTVTVKSTGTNSIEVDITWMLAYEDIDVSGIYCRGNTGAMPSLP
jgi:hypothetical protein